MNKFTVLMSVYSKESPSHLRECLKSLNDQTLLPNEIVIVKDGVLTEDLNKEIDNFMNKDFDIKIVPLQNNVGLGEALNIGLEYCSYNYVVRMDSDDICISDRFKILMNYLNKKDNIDVLGSFIQEFDMNDNKTQRIRKVPLDDRDIKKYAKRRNPMNHVSVVFKKDKIIEAGGYKHFLWNEDYFLWIRMMKLGMTFENINLPLVKVRVGKEMFKRRGGLQYLKMDFLLQKKFLDIGFISKMDFLINSLIRFTIRIAPNKLRSYIYLNLLRNHE